MNSFIYIKGLEWFESFIYIRLIKECSDSRKQTGMCHVCFHVRRKWKEKGKRKSCS